jgi:ribosomal protein L16/L10AE
VFHPKRVLYLKKQRRRHNNAIHGGLYDLYSLIYLVLKARGLFSSKSWHVLFLFSRRLLKKKVKKMKRRGLYYWVIYFPQQSLTKKSKFSRMGKGKGKIKRWGVFLPVNTTFVKSNFSRSGLYIFFFMRLRYIFKLKYFIIFQ